MMKKIIENTGSAQQEFMREADAVQSGGGSNTITLSREELAALLQGACVAVDDGEYSTFIVLDKENMMARTKEKLAKLWSDKAPLYGPMLMFVSIPVIAIAIAFAFDSN